MTYRVLFNPLDQRAVLHGGEVCLLGHHTYLILIRYHEDGVKTNHGGKLRSPPGFGGSLLDVPRPGFASPEEIQPLGHNDPSREDNSTWDRQYDFSALRRCHYR